MSIIHDILVQATKQGASDIHLKSGQAPCFRVSGEIVESQYQAFTDDDMRRIVADILPEHISKRNDDASEIDLSHDEPDVGRFRVNIFMSRNVPTIAMRHVKTQIPSLEALHLPPQIEKTAEAHSGIIMLSGATSSGKSTTLAAIMQCINQTQRLRVITIEDPIEYLFTDDQCLITQREVGLDTPSFHSALKHVLRQDPDVIMVGEMRDDTSLRVALSAAETGHLVLTTIHANTAPQAITRILEYFPVDERSQVRMALAGNLQAIICQRLIPSVDGKVRPGVEIMLNTPTIRKLLQKNELETLAAAIETGVEDGMQTFNQSIYKLIKSGEITERNGLEYASNPEALKMNLQGIFLDESRRILGS